MTALNDVSYVAYKMEQDERASKVREELKEQIVELIVKYYVNSV
jgi:hypothetical protein